MIDIRINVCFRRDQTKVIMQNFQKHVTGREVLCWWFRECDYF